MSRFVCIGPTAHGLPESAFRRVARHPPAARGDLLRLVDDGATAILLIDGLYGDRPSVSHKEILFALSRGVAVIGAASLGALRAAECAAFGMAGIGAVFADYQSGARTSDADVAVLHAPEALRWRPLSVSLVDIDATLDAAAERIGPTEAAQLASAARRLHFERRQWDAVVAAAQLPPDRIPLLERHRVYRKREDARAALDLLRAGPAAPVPLDFEPTDCFLADLRRFAPGLLRR
ncbi:TfuA-like protein [Tropicimonas marinistellae]|uniref:TfuA-like protein n=1 Tax=Tropicimonas marinistellae TaxID=1739787 RepID=UPI00082A5451|nr:TfuA-like protein [Tropicimonas marinistellae]